MAMQTPLNMGIGGTLDCGSGQPLSPYGVVTEIWVPEGFYDVASLALPPRDRLCRQTSCSNSSALCRN